MQYLEALELEEQAYDEKEDEEGRQRRDDEPPVQHTTTSSASSSSAMANSLKSIRKSTLLDEFSIPQRFWPLIALERYKHLFSFSSSSSLSSVDNQLKEKIKTTSEEVPINTINSNDHDVSNIHEINSRRVGSRVIIFGSSDPWAECLVIALGARSITTVE